MCFSFPTLLLYFLLFIIYSRHHLLLSDHCDYRPAEEGSLGLWEIVFVKGCKKREVLVHSVLMQTHRVSPPMLFYKVVQLFLLFEV